MQSALAGFKLSAVAFFDSGFADVNVSLSSKEHKISAKVKETQILQHCMAFHQVIIIRPQFFYSLYSASERTNYRLILEWQVPTWKTLEEAEPRLKSWPIYNVSTVVTGTIFIALVHSVLLQCSQN